MTKTQTRIYKYIEKQYKKDRTNSISRTQAAKDLGISRTHLNQQIELLVARGYLEKQSSLIPC